MSVQLHRWHTYMLRVRHTTSYLSGTACRACDLPMELAAQQDYPLGLRQLAALLLKQHIKQHWAPEAKHFAPPAVGDAEKAAVRRDLVAGLADPEAKVRVAVGMAVAGIAKWDVPAAWPELLGQLVGAIAARRDARAVHGAVRCLAMFVDELDDAQVVHVSARGPLISNDIMSLRMHACVALQGIPTHGHGLLAAVQGHARPDRIHAGLRLLQTGGARAAAGAAGDRGAAGRGGGRRAAAGAGHCAQPGCHAGHAAGALRLFRQPSILIRHPCAADLAGAGIG